MSYECSIYDAKARFSEILRKVREGKVVTITLDKRQRTVARKLGFDTRARR